ncbi:MAG: efflux RND transporter periplasmic adaptor subunit [Polyangiaceae bacterium]|nr:efflux RND transporter periplasmic adaptor subunit [Polyangiaceae bacterium]
MASKKNVLHYLLVIAGLLVIVGALAATKAAQIRTLIGYGKKAAAAGPPPESVATALAETHDWQGTFSAVGSVTAAKGVAVSNDAPGLVTRIHFESGETVKKGQVLVELDTNVERAQLDALNARADLARVNAQRTLALVDAGALSPSQLDNDEAVRKSSIGDVDALRAQIERKTVRAPFAGKLGIRAVNLGQYLNPGTPVTSLETIDTVYVDFTLPQQRLADLSVGLPIQAKITGTKEVPIAGSIFAIDPAVDTTTRTIRLRAAVPNKEERLRAGMFVDVSIELPKRAAMVVVPATAIMHASYGDSVFIVEDKKPGSPGLSTTADGKPVHVAHQQFVRTGEARGDFVAIAMGLSGGERVVASGGFKLRNGSPIVINEAADSGNPKPELNPQPENH